jgi:hypothetical protein
MKTQLKLVGKDIYGFLMQDEGICSYYAHKRFILYYYMDFVQPSSQYELRQVYVQASESFDPYTSMKTFDIDTYHPVSLSYTALFMNYTLYDGLNFKNGLLVKYYSNDNF